MSAFVGEIPLHAEHCVLAVAAGHVAQQRAADAEAEVGADAGPALGAAQGLMQVADWSGLVVGLGKAQDWTSQEVGCPFGVMQRAQSCR